jgi:hypothetical protein
MKLIKYLESLEIEDIYDTFVKPSLNFKSILWVPILAPSGPEIEAFHQTSDNNFEKLEKLNSEATISCITATREPLKLFENSIGSGGNEMLVKVSGNLLLSFDKDVKSQKDNTGLRWINLYKISPKETEKIKAKINKNFDLEKYKNFVWKEFQDLNLNSKNLNLFSSNSYNSFSYNEVFLNNIKILKVYYAETHPFTPNLKIREFKNLKKWNGDKININIKSGKSELITDFQNLNKIEGKK